MPGKTNHRSARTVGRVAILAGAIVGVGGLWYIASSPWGISAAELAPFIAPGALLGIGAAWVSYTWKRDQWTWIVTRNAAITGALVLPPIIAVGFALVGARPERVLSSTVRAAWLALAGGAVWGLGLWLLHRFEHRAS